jgi:hypothetical protein
MRDVGELVRVLKVAGSRQAYANVTRGCPQCGERLVRIRWAIADPP